MKILPEEKIKQEKIIPFLRDVLGYRIMDFEFPVRFGRMTKFADILIYKMREHKKIPHIVVECKATGKIRDDDWLQAESYAQRLGAPYFVVTDGTKTKWFWYKSGSRQGESTLIDQEKIPHEDFQKVEGALIRFEDRNSLSRIMQQCHDIIRNEEGRDPAESFDEMSKLLFAKMKDEKDVSKEKKMEYDFRIKKGDTASSVANRIVQLFDEAKEDYPNIYGPLESKNIKKLIEINLKNNTMFQIVGILEPYTLIKTTTDEKGVDIKGTVFETFLKSTFRGPLGQFFTPREIIDFMTSVMNPQPNQTVIDPACGSGGFLISAMEKVWSDFKKGFEAEKLDDLEEQKKHYAENNLFGIDINERLGWVAKMNMVFHGDGHGGILHGNSLIMNTRTEPLLRKKYDIVMTNPPFGSRITDPKILSDPRFKEISRKGLTEILFLGVCVDLLQSYGKLGIVLPDGILSNSSLRFVRNWIRNNTIIKAIVSLPNETFIPFGAGVKASLIFLERKNPLDPYQKQGPVFMAMAENIGYDSTGRPTGKNDLIKILDEYHEFERKYYKRR